MKYDGYDVRDLEKVAEFVRKIGEEDFSNVTLGADRGDIHLYLDGEETPFVIRYADNGTYELSLVVPL